MHCIMRRGSIGRCRPLVISAACGCSIASVGVHPSIRQAAVAAVAARHMHNCPVDFIQGNTRYGIGIMHQAGDDTEREPELARLHRNAMTELMLLDDDHEVNLYMRLLVSPLRRLFSWAVPSREALDALVDASPQGIIEIGCGTGYWAAELLKAGATVAAYEVLQLRGACV